MRKRLLVLLAALLLVSFVSPFSCLPNPLGVYYLVAGGYSYDPRVPFLSNGFALLRADASAAISAKLDGLIGTTGLDPLDPIQPLQGYEIERVTYGPGGDWAKGTVRMLYADGSSRWYEIPVVQPSQARDSPGRWAYTGLDRLYAPHQELPSLPLANPEAPVRLGPPERLPLPDRTHQLGSEPVHGWYTSIPREGEIPIWAPDGKSFLINARTDARGGGDTAELWLVRLNGSSATRLADDARYPVWTAEGRYVAFVRVNRRGPPLEIVSLEPTTREERVLAAPNGETRLAAAAGALWFISDGSLWQVDPGEGAPVRMGTLPDPGNPNGDAAFALSPDGGRVAYRSVDALALSNADGSNHLRMDLGAPPRPPAPAPPPPGIVPTPGPAPTAPPASRRSEEPGPASERASFARLALAWSPNGERLAAVASSYGSVDMPVMWILDRSGAVLHKTALGPNGLVDTPQWTPDGRWVFVNAFPEAGRRIVAVEVESGRVYDLSQPRWDTFFSLAPNGQELLLWNGRGGFWTVPVETR